MKPQLAEDAQLDKLIFPVIGQPKIDGVRAWNPAGTLLGRSMDPFKGFGVTEYFSRPELVGLDGEMIVGTNPASQDRLCSVTSGAMGKFKGVAEMADFHWWVFDDVSDPTKPYINRYYAAYARVDALCLPNIHMVPFEWVHSKEEALALMGRHIDEGYEGTIWRNPDALYKAGRATLKGQELWRSKPWAEDEMLVTAIIEGSTNTNEAKTNSLGRTERSSAQEGLVPNGQVGALQGTLIKDVYSPFTGKKLFEKGLLVTIGSGEMTVAEAIHFFQNQHEIVGHVAKFKHMTHGVKDLPRMGTFVSLRLAQDMS